ncbi:LOW QUALITY PROTEIN: anaphase-promoting complex subunit 1 [Lepeophtheirus salmonis]|uniref:LOW QUALITY PROTEIN: anaphase-promoting complex subunit 1 n=1 Tax=Lepeophtheirus salmonis TaxID=72036 RepID=UPI001AE59DFD|nr:LOW QUALITY PROTEIN: anaphase-promoting complex subunit 1-like [Lepeophtheirus salmonis]
MVYVKETKEFIPAGRIALRSHPGKTSVFNGQPSTPWMPPGMEMEEDENKEIVDEKEEWTLMGRDNALMELYTKGNTVVWSQHPHVIKSYTGEGEVKQALWFVFHEYPKCPSIINSCNLNRHPMEDSTFTPVRSFCKQKEQQDYELGDPIPSIVIHESGTLKIFTEKGEDFSTALPIPIKKCWPSKYGLLLERDCQGRQNLPVLFALLHPLGDITRIVMKERDKSVGPILSENQRIIFTSENPSICVIYDSLNDHHSVWKIRKATSSEGKVSSLRPSSTSSSFVMDAGTSQDSLSRSHSHTNTSNSNTPINSHNNSILASTANGTSGRTNSHSPFSTLAAICRSPSTTAGGGGCLNTTFASRLMDCSNNIGHKSISFRMGDDFNQQLESLPPEVSLCLEHLWSEPKYSSLGSAATKIFISKDVVERTYLNYLVPEFEELFVVRFDESNDGMLIFNIVQKISAVDAIFVESLNMTLILEPTSSTFSLILYSGVKKVSMFAFKSIYYSNIAYEISTLHLDSKPGTPTSRKILTSSRPPSATIFNTPLIQPCYSPPSLSPIEVPQNRSINKCFVIQSLKDAVHDKVFLKFVNGLNVQITVPPMATTSLVRRCIAAIKTTLPREIALHFQVKWYAVRNSPGPASVSPSREWELFSRCLMGLMGYHADRIKDESRLMSPSSNEGSGGLSSSKKMRKEKSGSDGDWQHLLSSFQHREVGKRISNLLGLEEVIPDNFCLSNERKTNSDEKCNLEEDGEKYVNSEASLFTFMPSILWSLHLLYENSKLDMSHWEGMNFLACLLIRLSADLQMPYYVDHYWRDFPEICPIPTLGAATTGQLREDQLKKLQPLPQMTERPPCIYSHLRSILSREKLSPFPYISKVAKRTRDMIYCYAVYASPADQQIIKLDDYIQVVNIPGNREEAVLEPISLTSKLWHGRVVDLLLVLEFDSLDSLPPGLSLPLRSAIFASHKDPSNWPSNAYQLIGREDLALRDDTKAHVAKFNRENSGSSKKIAVLNQGSTSTDAVNDSNFEDGTETSESSISKLRWPNDRRLYEVRRLLQSARPVTVFLKQKPEMTDHEFVEEQEKHLHSLCVRTMALPVGRGALTLRTSVPIITEPLSIPKLCLTGRAPPRGATIEMEHIDVAPNEERWPTFHNGVAAGLQMRPDDIDSQIDSAWITFNKPKESSQSGSSTANNNNNNANNSSNSNNLVEHSGFLMALGLNGHLSKLGKLELYDYLINGNEMVSIGILLGISAAKRGTMDVLATKKVSTQLEALLPATATELPISHATQVAGLVGLGLLYQGTGHHHMAEVCLGELGRPPGPELENCTDRESYSLAAGLALGMITLGRGNSLSNSCLSDLDLPDTLYHHMVGGSRSAIHQRYIYRSPSYQIQEGDSINIDVTSPGATLALGMMFFRSGNETIAEWMSIPKTQFLLEFVRPDFLMLRTLAKGLIMWDRIIPSKKWIESHVPDSIKPHCLVRPPDNSPSGIDYETINQAYCNIISGAALVMGLRFAGSCNAQAFEVLHDITRRLIAISKRSVAELAGKATIEQTICVHVLAMSIIMAGSGEIKIIRIVRYLRSRTGNTNSTVTYGSHMALHMALGLLFIGGGRYTLSTKPEAVAAMLCAFFPKFPTHSNDNRYHLQALRHLYVLAAEPRLIVPTDVETNSLSFCHIEITYMDTAWYKCHNLKLKAPCMLPELRYLSSVSICDDRYHPVHFDLAKGTESLKKVLEQRYGQVYIKRRAGCVGYIEDPHGFRSLIAQCLTRDPSFKWDVSSRLLDNFSNVPGVSNFHDIFLKSSSTNEGDKMKNIMGTLLYECACKEKLNFLPVWMDFFSNLESLGKSSEACRFAPEQLSLFTTFAEYHRPECSLLSKEMATSVLQNLNKTMDSWKSELRVMLRAYLTGNFNCTEDTDRLKKLTSFLIISNLPVVIQSSSDLPKSPKINPLEWLGSMKGSNAHNIYLHISD